MGLISGLDPTVQTAIIGGAVSVMLAIVSILGEMTRRQRKDIKDIKEDTAEAVSQVANSHGTNLRDDLDRAINTATRASDYLNRISDDIKRILAAQEQYGSDLHQERAERLALSSRLDRHIDRHTDTT